MAKIVFQFNVDNVIDIITNSSSELFILEGESSEIISDMIHHIYEDYLEEYREPKLLKDCSVDDVLTLLYYRFGDSLYETNIDISHLKCLEGINPEEFYIYKYYRNGDKYVSINDEWVKNNIELIANSLDPQQNKYLMFSLDENPNWEMQEKLMKIAERIHLG